MKSQLDLSNMTDDERYKLYKKIALRFLKENGWLPIFKLYLSEIRSTKIEYYTKEEINNWYKKECIIDVIGNFNLTKYILNKINKKYKPDVGKYYYPLTVTELFAIYIYKLYGENIFYSKKHLKKDEYNAVDDLLEIAKGFDKVRYLSPLITVKEDGSITMPLKISKYF